jgi:hypothetical protein
MPPVNVEMLTTAMPLERPTSIPELTMPRRKRAALATPIAVNVVNDAAEISLPLPMTMPWLVARMLPPKSKIAPVMVLSAMEMPVFAEIVPELKMPPAPPPPNAATRLTNMPAWVFEAILPPLMLAMAPANVAMPTTAMPVWRPEIVPVLVMPPPALLLPNTLKAVLLTKMPAPLDTVIFPLLLMPPKKLATCTTPMPECPAAIVPLLVMPPRRWHCRRRRCFRRKCLPPRP